MSDREKSLLSIFIGDKIPSGNLYCHAENNYKSIKHFDKIKDIWRPKDGIQSIYRCICRECEAKGDTLDKVFPPRTTHKISIKHS